MFAKYSLDVVGIFSGYFHDVHRTSFRMFSGYFKDALVGIACLVGLVVTVSLMGLVGLVGLLGFFPKLKIIRYDAPNPRNNRNITMMSQ